MKKTHIVRASETETPLAIWKRGMVTKAYMDPGITMEKIMALGEWRLRKTY
jgi:hypothetical protein